MTIENNSFCVIFSFLLLILTSPGPFATVQLVQKGQFNGKSRPKAADILEVLVKLRRDGFGQPTKSVPTTVFLKELPCDVSHRSLGVYGIEPDIYLINFKKRDPTERIPKKLFNRVLQLAPNKEDLSSIYSIDSEIELQPVQPSLTSKKQ